MSLEDILNRKHIRPTTEALKTYLGDVPDFNDTDWEELKDEFDEGEYQALSPAYIRAWQRSNKRFLETAVKVQRIARTYVSRDVDGDCSDEAWGIACQAAWEQEERLGHYIPNLHHIIFERARK